MNFVTLIPNICEGLPFKKKDCVLLNFWGDNEDLEILDSISECLSKKGVIPFKHHCSNSFFKNVVLNLIENNQEFPEKYFEYLSSFRYVIDIFMYTPSLPNGISKEDIPKYKKYLSQLFTALTEDKKYYIQLTVPTEINARNAGLNFDIYNSLICNALDVDFNELKKACKKQIEELKDKNSVNIITGKKYSLKLDFNDRKWYVDDGCGDFPAGEVSIAPIENSSNGDLLVPIINLREKIYKDVLMTFENGKLIKCSSEELDEFFNSLPENYKILCEFAIGLNPKVKQLTGFTLVDEKALGTYHIGIGMNYLSGGTNNCPFHMDFVFYCDEIVFN
ncbi:aminopeptidase [Sporanaerobacter acetigenes]|uniref:Thermophilic metalloprotease (M29) n=3 Tax=Sporanaerobacter acetigenes TaxID=165813 RepID=A0A1M5WDF0_9FIRM|nr:aminopeptidase [Sporanaerobacter acetigenes]SHH85512.1 Thermophilic metalloprotease (M29) [Sporanaerobacter acetigenes DSM 13106]